MNYELNCDFIILHVKIQYLRIFPAACEVISATSSLDT